MIETLWPVFQQEPGYSTLILSLSIYTLAVQVGEALLLKGIKTIFRLGSSYAF